jgi:hypothetical protein
MNMEIKGWKFCQSSKDTKTTDEDWFISWEKENLEIEIKRFYDDDKNKWQGFEVWEQLKVTADSYDGTHIDTFRSRKKAVEFAISHIKKINRTKTTHKARIVNKFNKLFGDKKIKLVA